jgi:hypothetical protein
MACGHWRVPDKVYLSHTFSSLLSTSRQHCVVSLLCPSKVTWMASRSRVKEVAVHAACIKLYKYSVLEQIQ